MSPCLPPVSPVCSHHQAHHSPPGVGGIYPPLTCLVLFGGGRGLFLGSCPLNAQTGNYLPTTTIEPVRWGWWGPVPSGNVQQWRGWGRGPNCLGMGRVGWGWGGERQSCLGPSVRLGNLKLNPGEGGLAGGRGWGRVCLSVQVPVYTACPLNEENGGGSIITCHLPITTNVSPTA